MLDIDDELKKYVTNYKLNLYDCQEHNTFNEYQTGLRQVFETVRYAKDKEKLKEIMEENREVYSMIDSDTKDMLEIVANVKIPEKYKTVGHCALGSQAFCVWFDEEGQVYLAGLFIIYNRENSIKF